MGMPPCNTYHSFFIHIPIRRAISWSHIISMTTDWDIYPENTDFRIVYIKKGKIKLLRTIVMLNFFLPNFTQFTA